MLDWCAAILLYSTMCAGTYSQAIASNYVVIFIVDGESSNSAWSSAVCDRRNLNLS